MSTQPLVRHQALPAAPVPQRAIDAIAADAHLPVCATCGTQFSTKPEGICESDVTGVAVVDTVACTLPSSPSPSSPHHSHLPLPLLPPNPLTPPGPCCEDERQWYPATGQVWTTLAELASSRTHSLKVDTEDARIAFIECEPAFAINQTRKKSQPAPLTSKLTAAILINTHAGHYIWDCQAPFTPSLAGYLSSLQPALKAISISHPHVS